MREFVEIKNGKKNVNIIPHLLVELKTANDLCLKHTAAQVIGTSAWMLPR